MPSESNPGAKYVEMEFDADSPSGAVIGPDGRAKTRKEIYAEASEATEILDDYNGSHLLDEFDAFNMMYDISQTEARDLRKFPYVVLHGGFHEDQNNQLRDGIAYLPTEKFDAVFDSTDMTTAEIRSLPLALHQAKFPLRAIEKMKSELESLYQSNELFVMETVFDFTGMSEHDQNELSELMTSGMLPGKLNARLAEKIENLKLLEEES